METLVVLFAGGFAAWLILAGLRVLARGAASGWRGWRQRRQNRRPAPPPQLTAPPPNWAVHDLPTWRRRGLPSPLSAPVSALATQRATPPQPPPTPSGGVVF